MSPRFIRIGAVAAFVAALLLALQFVIGVGIGNDFALMSKTLDPARMTALFQTHANALTALMTADDAFALAYAVAFIAPVSQVFLADLLAGEDLGVTKFLPERGQHRGTDSV